MEWAGDDGEILVPQNGRKLMRPPSGNQRIAEQRAADELIEQREQKPRDTGHSSGRLEEMIDQNKLALRHRYAKSLCMLRRRPLPIAGQ
jgi:hypothetical protein